LATEAVGTINMGIMATCARILTVPVFGESLDARAGIQVYRELRLAEKADNLCRMIN
jgi:hypothetical protein